MVLLSSVKLSSESESEMKTGDLKKKEKDEKREYLGLGRPRLFLRACHLLSFSRTVHACHLFGWEVGGNKK